jgi:hypothetical protein
MTRKQEKMFDEQLNPPLVNAADRYVELKNEQTEVKDRLDAQERNLIGLMKKAGKYKIKHQGKIIEISEIPGKEKLKLKENKKTETK